jgi:hypothetical protein
VRGGDALSDAGLLDDNEGVTASTSPDLFSPEQGCEVFLHLRNSPYCEDVRVFVRGLWDRFRETGLADPDFTQKFPLECPQRIWEMRLACTLLGWGIRLIPSPKPGAGMDFGIDLTDGRRVWIEATCPAEGDAASPDKVSAPYDQVFSGASLDRTRALRYLNAVSAKREQFRRARDAGLVGDRDGLIVAISGARIPMGDVEVPGELPLIVKSLFGIGETTLVVEVGTGRAPYVGPALPRPFVRKASGSEVDAKLFGSPDAEEVTAVLFDPHHVKNCAEVSGRPAGTDFSLAHNPFARTPVSVGLLREGTEFGVLVGPLRPLTPPK